MNDKLLTHDGGQPFLASDFSFIQNALLASIGHLSRANGERYILWGVLSEDKQSIVEGAVVIDGNVYQVPALGAINSQYLCFREREYDERIFENGTSFNVKATVDVYLSANISDATIYIRPETLQTVDEIKLKKTFFVKEVTTNEPTDYYIYFDEPIELNENDIVISTCTGTVKDSSPSEYISTTSLAVAKKEGQSIQAKMYWQNEYYGIMKDGIGLGGLTLSNVSNITISFIVIKL